MPISTGAATQTQCTRSFCCADRHSQLLLEGIPSQGSLDIPAGYRAGRELLREVRTNPLKAFPAPVVSNCSHSGIVKDWSCGYKFIFYFLLCMKESQKSGSEWGREGEISRRKEFPWYQECPAAYLLQLLCRRRVKDQKDRVSYNFWLVAVTLHGSNFIALNCGSTNGLILMSISCSKTRQYDLKSNLFSPCLKCQVTMRPVPTISQSNTETAWSYTFWSMTAVGPQQNWGLRWMS